MCLHTLSASKTLQGLMASTDSDSAASLALSAMVVFGAAAALRHRQTLRAAASAGEKVATVIIPNRAVFEAKRQAVVAGGIQKLQIVSDFDRTITAFHDTHGKQGLSCHGVVESTPVLSSAYKQAAASLFQHYYPIETDAKLSSAQKIPLMTEWYGKGHDLLVAEGFKRQNLADAVHESTERGRIKLREGFSTIFDISKQHSVPLLIFSAGIGNVLSMIIERLYGDTGPQCTVVSNFMRFDKAGHLVGFYDPLVHMYNKNAEHLADKTEYQAAVSERPHVLLLGDSLGDVTMADGQAKAPEVVLRVGFLNSKVDDLLEQYMDAFDVVVLNDDSAEVAVRILEDCLASEQAAPREAAAGSAGGD